MHFRKAILEDVPELTSLRVAFLEEADGAHPILRDALASAVAQYFRTHIPTSDFINWNAMDKGRIVATGGICFHAYPPVFGSLVETRGYIMNIYTLPAWRRQGLARKILGKLLTEARHRGAVMINLHATEIGKGLYHSEGFAEKYTEMSLHLEAPDY